MPVLAVFFWFWTMVQSGKGKRWTGNFDEDPFVKKKGAKRCEIVEYMIV